jgi:hypothetical protein
MEKKPTKQEVIDLIKYCSDKGRTIPHNWYRVMEIIEYSKLMPHVQKGLQCLILMVWNTTSKEEKVKVFHNQIKYAGYHSFKKDKIFYELKDFLMNLPEEKWYHQEI